MSTEKQTRQEYFDHFENLFEKRPFLLENGLQFFTTPDYYSFLARKFGTTFSMLDLPWGYELDILDQYKDQIVYTTHVADNQSNTFLVTLIQVSPDLHIHFIYRFIPEEHRMFAYSTVYASHGRLLQQFMQDNKKFKMKTDDTAFGFKVVK